MKQRTSKYGPRRFLAPSLEALWERLGERPPSKSRIVEHVYLDTGYPSLHYTGFVRGRRIANPEAEPFDPEGSWALEHRLSASEPLVRHPGRARLEDIDERVASAMDLTGLVPCFGVRFRRERYEVDGLRFDVDHDVTWYSLLGPVPFRVGQESVPRVTARVIGKDKHGPRLAALLEGIPSGPYTTKKWMGFHFVKCAYELPRRDELPGWEYELKLDVDALDVDIGRLPFPVIEVHQSDSLRHYYRSYRASVRGEQAHIVEKGPVEDLGGVLKRPERKLHGMRPWDMPDPRMVMRRYKREINVLNPDTGRVYTLSLHHCDAGPTLQQLEIEYDGRLVPGAVTEMARFRADHDTRRLLTMAAQADDMGWTEVGDSLRERWRRLTPDAGDVLPARHHGELPPGDAQVEAAVVEDMRLLRSWLMRSHGFRVSRLTKRKWLRAVYAERS